MNDPDEKMRNARQVKVINSQLEVLGELKEQLQSVFGYIDNVMLKGTSWIEEVENASFNEIHHYLTNEISECFQKCLNLANGNEELSQSVNASEEDKGIPPISVSSLSSARFTDKENKQWTEKMSVVEKLIPKQSKTVKTIKQKIQEQENETAEIKKSKEDMVRKNDMKIKEIMTELQAASNFMSELQMKNELLEQKLNSFAIENVSKHAFDLDEINKIVSENCEDIKEIKNQSGSLMTSLKEVEKKLEDVLLVVEPLKSSFNFQAEKEDLNLKMGNVDSKVKEVLSRISKIESTDLAIGFEACPENVNIHCHKNEILTCFTNVVQNLGNNFDTQKGIYTVPFDGIYLCALFIEINSFVKNEVFLDLFDKRSKSTEVKDHEEEVLIGSCHIKSRGQTSCDVIFRKLKLGDQLYVKYMSNEQHVQFNTYSHFNCVLLKPCLKNQQF